MRYFVKSRPDIWLHSPDTVLKGAQLQLSLMHLIVIYSEGLNLASLMTISTIKVHKVLSLILESDRKVSFKMDPSYPKFLNLMCAMSMINEFSDPF